MLFDGFVLAWRDASVACKAVSFALGLSKHSSEKRVERVDGGVLILGSCNLFSADLDCLLCVIEVGRENRRDGLLQLGC